MAVAPRPRSFTPQVAAHVDWAALPAAVRAELRALAPLLIEGEPYRAIAERLGRSAESVSASVAAIREAIAQQTRVG